MSLAEWEKHGWLRPHKPSKEEVTNLLEIVDRDLKDALAHFRTLQALPEILGTQHKANADYLDTCRKKRNETEYDFAGNVSSDEVAELMKFCVELKSETLAWLKKNHPKLI